MPLKKEIEAAPVKIYDLLNRIINEFNFSLAVPEKFKNSLEEIVIPNLVCNIEAKISLSIETYDRVPGTFRYRYFGPVRNKDGRIVGGDFSAHVIEGVDCRGRYGLKIKRHDKTPSWFPMEDYFPGYH